MNTSTLTIPVSEGNLHIPVYGIQNNIPVVFLHGTAAYHYCWRNVVSQMASTYRVYCPDLLGSGFSDKPKEAQYSKHAHAQRIISVLKKLDCGPVHLIGHSLGGEIATHIALEAPDLIKSLTLIAPDGFRKGVIPPIKWMARKGWMDGIFRKAMRNQMKPKMLSRMLGLPLEHFTLEFMENWTKPFAHPNLPYIIAKSLADDDTGILSESIKQIAIPTLLIYGTKDKFIPKRVFERYQLELPSITTVVYESYGHILMEQCPGRLAASIEKFIQ